MHYWIGTTFTVPEQSLRAGPVSINDQTKIKNKSPFQSNVPYTIFYIKHEPNGTVTYQFKNEITGEDLFMTFGSVAAAEQTIAAALKEPLPDYSAFHFRNRS